ncbi:TolC family protein [Rhabdobacter roseus]|uniref:Cobalt-zinc-cadmium efflux system outer membrane protein n=1 Tax=Rhabdobacter roseus TaxID=1655419 RepID=A0A840TPL3_9BACT|nr:TolC family protein [Rhabdobacter roseus]MBB5281990.1 cobalt-zinc-cadmium efflux system outer membrane protein [Rhabdobacter roseus]
MKSLVCSTRLVLLCVLLSTSLLSAQTPPADTLRLTRPQAEARFLEKNVLLVAEKLNIEQSEALIRQARLWPNPSVSVEEVNLWATRNQLSLGEELPPYFNNVGRNRQVAVQLEQVLLTAGKRRKQVALEEVSRDRAITYFEDLLRNLKVELRQSLVELQYLQLYQAVFADQITQTQQLLTSYERQTAIGNINRAEVVRLKALVLELTNESVDVQKQIHGIQRELVVLLNLPAPTYLVLDTADFIPDLTRLEGTSAQALVERALAARPDLTGAQQDITYQTRLVDYERALRKPDLTVGINYDRGGNFLKNFIGFGVGMDLPVFNRNQGNIKYAQLGVQKSELLRSEKKRQIEAEVLASFKNLQTNVRFYTAIEPTYEDELDRLLQSYTANFRNRNVSMLEYLDFFEAYLDNKKTIINARKELSQTYEELQYVVGAEL